MFKQWYNKYKSLARSLSGWGLLFLCAAGADAATLDDVSFAALPGDRFEARIQFSEPPPEPQSYTIEQPARIVMDFPGVDNAVEENRIPLSVGTGKSAMVLSGDNRTRLILNLSELRAFDGRVEGNTYIVEVGGTNVAGSASGAQSQGQASSGFAAAAQNQSAADTSPGQNRAAVGASGASGVTNIDFRRGDEGEGRIIISLSSADVNVSMEESAGTIVLNFDNASIPASLANRYDVRDFATPVEYVDADNQRGGGIIRVDARGEYDYLAYQADDEYVISVKPLTPQEIEERQERFAYTGDRINLNFQDIEVRSVLQILADFTGLNLVVNDTVSGNITLRLENVPWDQALDIVLKTKGLDKRQVGNVLRVAPAAEIAEQEQQELETQRKLQELAPLRTEYIRIRYANAQTLYQLFLGEGGGQGGGSQGILAQGSEDDSGSGSGGILSSRGQAIVDDRTNSIILTDTEEKIAQFRELVEQIDIPIRQVQIEARIVIANTNFREQLGIRWGGIGVDVTNSHIIEAAGSRDSFDEDPGSPFDAFFNNGTTDLEENTIVDLGVTNPAGSIAVSVLKNNTFLDLELSALEDNGQAEIVSQPKVTTGDKQQATISSGSQIPYQEASASGATAISFQEALLKLDVTPQITPDNNIIMDLAINQDSIGEVVTLPGAGGSVPTIDVTQIETQVLVANGETVVLGGIYSVDKQNSVTKVPFLGDIPYLGRLFRRDTNSEQKSELLIFITPEILPETLAE